MKIKQKKSNGNEVLQAITTLTEALIVKGIEPKVIHIDSYTYYLLKDMLQRTGQKTTTGFFELYNITVVGKTLTILVDGETSMGGVIKPEILNVYGT